MTSDDNNAAPPLEAPEPPPHPSSGTRARIRNYFLTGLILVGPIYVTVSLTWWLILRFNM